MSTLTTEDLEAMGPDELLEAFTGQKERLGKNEKWIAGVERERELLQGQMDEALADAGVETVEELEALIDEELEKLRGGIVELDQANDRIEAAKEEYDREAEDGDGNGTVESVGEEEGGDVELDLESDLGIDDM